MRVVPLDLDILREMYPEGGVQISGIDPRLNANRIATRLGVSRARVSGRLSTWRELGFVARYDVWPNPLLFGLSGFAFEVRVAHRADKPEVIERIGLVPGAIGGIDYLGDWITVTFALPAEEDPRRAMALLRSLAGVAEVENTASWNSVDSPRALSPLELRVVRALRRFPTDSLTAIARHVGVSTRTITARYGRLLDEHAAWFIPVFDFRSLAEPVVTLAIEFATPGDRAGFPRALTRAFPNSLEFLRQPFGPVLPDLVGSFFVVADSAARVDEIERWVHRYPGVKGFESATLVRVLSFPDTFDRLLSAEVAPARSPKIK